MPEISPFAKKAQTKVASFTRVWTAVMAVVSSSGRMTRVTTVLDLAVLLAAAVVVRVITPRRVE